jgi:hypothetical protein
MQMSLVEKSVRPQDLQLARKWVLSAITLALLNPACALFQGDDAGGGGGGAAELVTKSYLYASTYDAASLAAQKLLAFEVNRETGVLTFVSSVDDLSNAQNPVILNGYLYVNSRGENKIRVFKIDPETGTLTDETAASGTAVTGIYVGGELAVDSLHGRLAIVYSAGSASGLKKVRFLQQDPLTGVLTQIGSGTDSSSGTAGIPDTLAFSGDLSQLVISTDQPHFGIGTVDLAAGTYSSAGVGGVTVGAMLAYPGTNFFLVSDATYNRIETFTAPLSLGGTSTQLLNSAYAYFMVKHPSLDVIYAAGSVMGISAYSFNATSGALTALNEAGGTTPISDPDAHEGLAVLSSGSFAFASHGVSVAPARIDIYPLDATAGSFGEGATQADLSVALPSGYPRFLITADFEI